MKLILKILGILILVVVLLLVTVPYFFRDQIIEKVKEEINNNINAQVDFTDFSLSLFRSFPNFNLELEGLLIENNRPFQGDTLAYIPTLGLTIDLVSVIKGDDAYEIRKIKIAEPYINLLTDEDGNVNWDIAIPEEEISEPGQTEETDGESSMLINLNKVQIINARIIYDDLTLPVFVLLEGVDHSLSGNFTLDFTSLKTYTKVAGLTVVYDGVRYFNKADAELEALVDADLVNSIYTLRKNELRLNRLFLGFDGSVAMQENDDINLMLTFASRKSDFKTFLSLIPAIYMTDYDGIETSGSLTVKGNIKGIYNDDSYPAFVINMIANDGMFKYPDLPKSVNNIDILTRITFPGGDLDNLVVDVSKFNFTMAGNPFSMSLNLKTPMSDPDVKGEINGQLNLAQVKDVYPLEEGDELEGKITAKVSFAGKMSAIENEKYDEFTALGSVLLSDMNFNSAILPNRVEIMKAQLNFSPEYLDLVSFKMDLGDNDFSANGKITNYMPYVFSDGILTGELNTSSNYFNLSALLPESSDTIKAVTNPEIPDEAPLDTSAMAAIEIPAYLNFTMNASFNKLIYDNIELEDVKGAILIKDQTISLDRLKMDVLDGTVKMSGEYNTSHETPIADFTLDLANIDFQKAYKTFGAIKKFAPIAEKTTGSFSANINLKTHLDKEMMPVYESMNGAGKLKTSSVIVENVNTLIKLADLLKMDDLKRLSLSPVNLTFEFVNGKLYVKPFDIKYRDITATTQGWTAFDQTIEYGMKLTVPRNKFGGAANSVLEGLVGEANKRGTNFSLGDKVNINVSIGGTLTDPKIQYGLGEQSGNMMEDLKRKVQEELERQKQKLEAQARAELAKRKAEARKEADKILADADKQAQKIIREAQKQADAFNKTTDETANQAKAEAEKQAKKLIDEARKNGPIAEMAAKATAENLKKEAFEEADKVLAASKTQSNKIIDTAKSQANKVKQDAQKRADKVLEGN